MKCADISAEGILHFLAKHQGEWCTWGTGYSMATVQDAMPKDTPPKLQLAKMRQLLKKGLVDGCGCGCRGDWEITDAGLVSIKERRTFPMIIQRTRTIVVIRDIDTSGL